MNTQEITNNLSIVLPLLSTYFIITWVLIISSILIVRFLSINTTATVKRNISRRIIAGKKSNYRRAA